MRKLCFRRTTGIWISWMCCVCAMVLRYPTIKFTSLSTGYGATGYVSVLTVLIILLLAFEVFDSAEWFEFSMPVVTKPIPVFSYMMLRNKSCFRSAPAKCGLISVSFLVSRVSGSAKNNFCFLVISPSVMQQNLTGITHYFAFKPTLLQPKCQFASPFLREEN